MDNLRRIRLGLLCARLTLDRVMHQREVTYHNKAPNKYSDRKWITMRGKAFPLDENGKNIDKEYFAKIRKAGNKNSVKEVSTEENISGGERAISKILNTHSDVNAAMYRKEIGDIDFVYGDIGTAKKKHKDGFGIAKIMFKHGEEAVKMIPEVIAKGEYEPSKYEDRAYFLYKGYRAVVRLTFDNEKRTWLVTNFEENKKGF